MLEEADAAPRSLSRGARGVNGAQEGMRNETDGMLENHLPLREEAAHDAAIATLDRILPRAREGAPGLAVQREENDSRRSPSEPVQGRGLRVAPAHAREKRVLEKASSGNGRKPRGLRDSENVLVLVQDGEAHGRRRFLPGGAIPDERLSGREGSIRGRGLALDQDQSALDAPLPLEDTGVPVALAQVPEESSSLRCFRQALAVAKPAIEAHDFRPTTYATQAFSLPPFSTRRKTPLPLPVFRSVPSQSTWMSSKPASVMSSRSSGRVQSLQS